MAATVLVRLGKIAGRQEFVDAAEREVGGFISPCPVEVGGGAAPGEPLPATGFLVEEHEGVSMQAGVFDPRLSARLLVLGLWLAGTVVAGLVAGLGTLCHSLLAGITIISSGLTLTLTCSPFKC